MGRRERRGAHGGSGRCGRGSGEDGRLAVLCVHETAEGPLLVNLHPAARMPSE